MPEFKGLQRQQLGRMLALPCAAACQPAPGCPGSQTPPGRLSPDVRPPRHRREDLPSLLVSPDPAQRGRVKDYESSFIAPAVGPTRCRGPQALRDAGLGDEVSRSTPDPRGEALFRARSPD